MEGSRRVGAVPLVCALLTVVWGCGGSAGEFNSGGATATVAQNTPTPVGGVTPTLPPMAPFSIDLQSADPPNIGIRQSGLVEQSVLTFRVTDQNSTPVSRVHVLFQLSEIGDETIFPLEAVTDQNGLVHTTLTSGIRASTVHILAGVDTNGNGTLDSSDLLAQSTAVSVLGAPPVRTRFRLSVSKLNVAGRILDEIEDPITAGLADRFGNAVPPKTVVNFQSNGAAVAAQTITNDKGQATVTLLTGAEIPKTGIVTVLAYTRGQKEFLDNNGDGIFDGQCPDGASCATDTDCGGEDCLARCPDLTACPADGDCTVHGGGVCDTFPVVMCPDGTECPADGNCTDHGGGTCWDTEPFVDFRPLPVSVTVIPPAACLFEFPPPNCPLALNFPPPNDADCIIPAGENAGTPLCNGLFNINLPFELFIDLPPKDGRWIPTKPNNKWDPNLVIFETIPITFSGHTQVPLALPQEFEIPNGGCQDFTVQVYDDLFNPLVGGSTINITSQAGTVFGGAQTVPDGESFNQIVDGLNRFSFELCDSDDTQCKPQGTSIVVTVTSPNDNITAIVARGSVDSGCTPSTPTP
jgi:hypothetical protein